MCIALFFIISPCKTKPSNTTYKYTDTHTLDDYEKDDYHCNNNKNIKLLATIV